MQIMLTFDAKHVGAVQIDSYSSNVEITVPPKHGLTCFECGTIFIPALNSSLNVSCDTEHVCEGPSCITGKGELAVNRSAAFKLRRPFKSLLQDNHFRPL